MSGMREAQNKNVNDKWDILNMKRFRSPICPDNIVYTIPENRGLNGQKI